MGNSQDLNLASTSIDRIDDPKAADTLLPESFKFTEQRFTMFRIGGDRTNS